MKKTTRKPVKVDETLREQVLNIIDQLYEEMYLLDRNKPQIALQIINSISSNYAHQNCGLHFIFQDMVKPYLKKMDENKRLEAVRDLLTNGFIDIGKQRVHMLFSTLLELQ